MAVTSKGKDLGKKDILHGILVKVLFSEPNDEETLPETNTAPRVTSSCVARIQNFLFSDDFYAAFQCYGDQVTRGHLDRGETGANSELWTKIHARYIDNVADEKSTDGIEKVHWDLAVFKDLKPSKFGDHGQRKLHQMWRKAQSDYKAAMINFTKSGTHNASFSELVED